MTSTWQADCDVLIIGGGIGGGALASRLASAGLEVTVLERQDEYRDMVRGEGMVPWGFTEAAALGIGDVVLGTDGANVVTRMIPYDEGLTPAQAEAGARDLANAVPGSPGVIGVGHVELRRALARNAERAGAAFLYGVHRLDVELGECPAVSFVAADGTSRRLRARLVVGADGKGSVTRAAADIALFTTRPRVMLSGMLVKDGGLWDRSVTTIGVDGLNQFIVVPRGDDLLRLYVGRSIDDAEPIRGPHGPDLFLDAYRSKIFPYDGALADSVPAGPLATYAMTDSWTACPLAPGVALIGDAAGWSNPVTAQGLSITLRDVRVLSEALLDGSDWSPDGLAGYASERGPRMARLRFASALTDLLSGFGADDRAARRRRMFSVLSRRPELATALTAVHAGPWSVPEEAFSPDILTTLALA